MNKFYPQNRIQTNNNFLKTYLSNISLALLLCAFFLSSSSYSQQVFTIVDGNNAVDTQGISPFATNIKNQRSQYLYTGDLLQNMNADSGYITAVAVNITRAALPSTFQPENLQIKMGLTTEVVLPATLVDNLPVFYSSAQENILGVGWYTITLDTPLYWDGYSNIIMEFCRTNATVGDSFEVGVHLGLVGEYRTVGLVSSVDNGNGCTLTGTTSVTLPNRRLLPSMRITMTNPCEANPFPGSIVVSEGNNYCGESFTLSAIDDTVASGLAYQWQYSFTDGTDFINIPGATGPTLTTTQDFATYYRRGTMCVALGQMFYPAALLVTSPDCLCNPTVTNNDASGITNVTFANIDSSSPSTPSYTNFSAIQADVDLVSTYTLSARVTAATTPLTTKAWIDWNQDGIFSVSESYNLGMMTSGTDVSSGMTASIVVPINALIGQTTMRVRTATVDDLLSLEPCGNTINGETEDYTIMVNQGLGLPNADLLKSSIVAFSTDKSVNVRSTVEDIKTIRISDIRGRLIYNSNDINNKETSISLPRLTSQILIVEIKTVSGFILNKKVSFK